MDKRIGLFVCIALLVSATLACGTVSLPTLNVGPMQVENQSLALEGATSADVQLLVGTGDLRVSPGAEGLLDGTFSYNVAEWKPKIERNKVGGLATLLVQQGTDKSSWGLAGRGASNEWNIRLGNSVPMRLTIGMGAGKTTLDLSGMQLARLSVDSGASDTTISFNVPNTQVMTDMQVNSGAGSLDLRSLGNANLERLDIKGGAGEMSLDFNGNWTRSASADVIAGVGQVTVHVPREIGVKVKTGPSVGKLVIDGLTQTADGYVNDAYATSAIKLDISLTTGVGEVTITTK